MPGFIRALIIASIFQVLAVVGLVLYMSNHDTNIAQEYARMAETDAKAYADTKILEAYNRIHQELAADRL